MDSQTKYTIPHIILKNWRRILANIDHAEFSNENNEKRKNCKRHNKKRFIVHITLSDQKGRN